MRSFKLAGRFNQSLLFSPFLLFLIVSFSPIAGYCQHKSENGVPFIRNYTYKEYEASNQIWSVNEDNRGVMYFGTTQNVLEYDGSKWRKVKFPGGSPLIVRALAKDNKGRIYWGGRGKFGYLKLDSLGETVGVELQHLVPEKDRDFYDVWTVHPTPEGIYFQSREKIFRLNDKNEVKVWYPKSSFMFSFYQGGTIYAHQLGLGIYKMVADSLQFITGSEFLGKERVQVMMPYGSNQNTSPDSRKYLFGMFNGGLYLYDGSSFKKFPTALDPILENTQLYKGARLQNGNYLLATTGRGVGIVDSAGNLVTLVNKSVGLQDETAYAIFEDKLGSIWLALDVGIAHINSSSPLTNIKHPGGGALSITRFKGDMYVGSTDGAFRLNSTTGNFEGVPLLSGQQIFELVQSGDDLIATGDGLYGIKEGQARLIKNSVSGDFQTDALYISPTHPRVLYVGHTFGAGIFWRSPKTNEWEFKGNVPKLDNAFWSFSEREDEKMWCGTQNGKMYLVTPVYKSDDEPDVSKFTFEVFDDKSGLNDSRGVLRIGNENLFPGDSQLFRFNEKTRRFALDTVFMPMLAKEDFATFDMTKDSLGRIWIRLFKKVVIATPKAGGGFTFDKSTLLPVGSSAIGRFYPEKNGIMWMGTAEGLVRYDENKKKEYDLPYETIIRHIVAGNHSQLNSLEDSTKEITPLDYANNTLRFEYAAPFFEWEEQTVYQTWLEGFEKDWSDWGNNFYKEYTNLSEANYVFHVRAKNIYERVSQEAIYHFTISPPWWRTWWAYFLYALAVLPVLYVLISYRTRHLKERHRELEKVVADRTSQLSQRVDELATVNNISKAVASQLSLDGLIKLVGDQLLELFKANIVYIALLDKKTNEISFPYQVGDDMTPLKLGEGLTSKILLTGEPLLINSDVSKQYSQLGIETVGVPAASYIGVPIPVGNEVIGVLSVQSTEKANRFTENDQRLLSTIAASVGVALRNAKLFEEVKVSRHEAEEARAVAEKANASKSAFLSTVSHELRTPLTSVLGFAKIIKKRLEEKIFPTVRTIDPKNEKVADQISENLNVVISEGERLTNLINDVLDLAKIEAGKMEWNMSSVSMEEVAERAIAATTSLFEQKNLQLEKHVEDNLPEIEGDHDKLIQVIVNLISNAVKFTPGGTVTCRVYAKDNQIVSSISDTGIGIAKEDYGAVFEQFKQVGGDTLTDKPKGTGLGLPICKEIIEHHGGNIWLESEPGKGSTFFFSLPIKKHPGIKPLQLDELLLKLKEQMAQSKLTNKGVHSTILVVDDDNSIRSLLQQELGDAGYHIEEASNGKEAIASIRRRRPDLIILDIMMPEMNGFDVAAILKNDPATMDIPIIVLSIVQDKARGFRIGVDRYLTKPINTSELFTEVGSLLGQGKSKRKVMVVDEDSNTVKTLSDVLEAKGYQVVESNGKELVERAVSTQPDIIILNSLFSAKQEIVQSLRFEKGLENVLFLIYQ